MRAVLVKPILPIRHRRSPEPSPSWDTVTGAGGRVVKLIGDEVMFVHADAGAACGIAKELIEHSGHHVRVGVGHGSMVAMHGDFYGAVVNLAARLVG